jgi:hypothetical protein
MQPGTPAYEEIKEASSHNYEESVFLTVNKTNQEGFNFFLTDAQGGDDETEINLIALEKYYDSEFSQDHTISELSADKIFKFTFQKGSFRKSVFNRTVAINLLKNDGVHELKTRSGDFISDTEFYSRVKDCDFDDSDLTSTTFLDHEAKKIIIVFINKAIQEDEELMLELEFESSVFRDANQMMVNSQYGGKGGQKALWDNQY